jgi:membrane protein implicated in regulation of membrane protease activity
VCEKVGGVFVVVGYSGRSLKNYKANRNFCALMQLSRGKVLPTVMSPGGDQSMELLFNPNLIYLLMMGGILLALLALLTPGTGLLELGAVLVLILVGIELFNMEINLWPLALVVIGAALYVLAIARKGDPLLLAAGLIIIFIGAALIFRGPNGGFAVSPWLVLVVSVIEGGFLWIVSRKVVYAAGKPPIQDLEKLIGRMGEARTRIIADGTVYVAGEEWSARSREPIPRGANVRVVGRDGFTLLVEQVPLPDNQPSVSESAPESTFTSEDSPAAEASSEETPPNLSPSNTNPSGINPSGINSPDPGAPDPGTSSPKTSGG